MDCHSHLIISYKLGNISNGPVPPLLLFQKLYRSHIYTVRKYAYNNIVQNLRPSWNRRHLWCFAPKSWCHNNFFFNRLASRKPFCDLASLFFGSRPNNTEQWCNEHISWPVSKPHIQGSHRLNQACRGRRAPIVDDWIALPAFDSNRVVSVFGYRFALRRMR